MDLVVALARERQMATLLITHDLAAVSVEDAVAKVHVRAIGRLDQEDLVGTDAQAPVGQMPQLRRRQVDALAHPVEHDEVVAGTLHLGKAQTHGAIMAVMTPRCTQAPGSSARSRK